MLQTFSHTGPVLGALGLVAHPVLAGMRSRGESARLRNLFGRSLEVGWANEQAELYKRDEFDDKVEEVRSKHFQSQGQFPGTQNHPKITPEQDDRAHSQMKEAEASVAKGINLVLDYTRFIEQPAVMEAPKGAQNWKAGYRGSNHDAEPGWLQAIHEAEKRYNEPRPWSEPLLKQSQEALEKTTELLKKIRAFRMNRIHSRIAHGQGKPNWDEPKTKYFQAILSRTIWLQARLKHCEDARKKLENHAGAELGSASMAKWRIEMLPKTRARADDYRINFPKKDDPSTAQDFDIAPDGFPQCDPRMMSSTDREQASIISMGRCE